MSETCIPFKYCWFESSKFSKNVVKYWPKTCTAKDTFPTATLSIYSQTNESHYKSGLFFVFHSILLFGGNRTEKGEVKRPLQIEKRLI